MDLKYNSRSSGYQAPAHTYPYSSYKPSPSESRGYASGYQSESTSPLPPHRLSIAACPQDTAQSDCLVLPQVGRKLSPGHLQRNPAVQGTGSNHRSPSPVPKGHSTLTFHLSTNYYLLNTSPIPYTAVHGCHHPRPSPRSPKNSTCPPPIGPPVVPPVGPAKGSHRPDETRVSAKFVQDSSQFWYKPSISRD
ncbi:hypothetical protein AAFF_G00142720 [Aldrovandia affinis]|uniref:Uncharacterized protein n=1 Tax=Aldrovandia affinis TaxID=143900 RepID=A0AAD7WWW0_9TELE|nr:hypothetical protein AAFF_G00142720 [Aldrovandia affinis]